MQLKNPEIRITPSDFGLKGNVKSMHYQSYFVEKGWFGIRKTSKGSGFLDTSFQELHFSGNKLVSEKGDDFSDGYDKAYSYDEEGRLAAIRLFAEHPYTKEIREYHTHLFRYIDADTLEQTNYIGYDRNFSRSTFTLKGNTIEELMYTEVMKSNGRKVIAFNEGGKIISEDEYDSEFVEGDEYLAYRTLYTYDSKNFMTEERHYQEDEEKYVLIITNDVHGNPILVVNEEDGEVVEIKKFIYKYDKYGNWVYREEYEVDEWNDDDFNKHKAGLKYIVKRKISYD